VQKIIEPLDGVKNVTFNITSKLVYVEHDFTQTTASFICNALNAGKFRASVKKDAGEKYEKEKAKRLPTDANR